MVCEDTKPLEKKTIKQKTIGWCLTNRNKTNQWHQLKMIMGTIKALNW